MRRARGWGRVGGKVALYSEYYLCHNLHCSFSSFSSKVKRKSRVRIHEREFLFPCLSILQHSAVLLYRNFFVSRRTLCIFFGAWYVVLSLFIAGTELSTYTFPWCFFLLHFVLVFLLGKLCGAGFMWKQYSLMSAASLMFSFVVLLGALTAPVEFRIYK